MPHNMKGWLEFSAGVRRVESLREFQEGTPETLTLHLAHNARTAEACSSLIMRELFMPHLMMLAGAAGRVC